MSLGTIVPLTAGSTKSSLLGGLECQLSPLFWVTSHPEHNTVDQLYSNTNSNKQAKNKPPQPVGTEINACLSLVCLQVGWVVQLLWARSRVCGQRWGVGLGWPPLL